MNGRTARGRARDLSLAAVCVAGLVLTVTAGMSDATAVPTSTTAAPTTAPATDVAASSEPAEPSGVPVLAPGSPVLVPLNIGPEAVFDAAQLLTPLGEMPWLLVGSYRNAPGNVSQVAVYTASGNLPAEWTLTASTGEEAAAWASTAVRTATGQAAVFGSVDSPVGPVPTWWAFDSANLVGPTVIGDPAVPGAVAQATVGADGQFYAAIQRPQPDAAPMYEFVTGDGTTWTSTTIDTDVRNLTVSGIAVKDDTIVLTGAGTSSDAINDRVQAMVFTSTDGGATFGLGDTTAFASSTSNTSFGPVVSTTDGFFAAACLPEDAQARYGYASSADGLSWVNRPFTDPQGTFPGGHGGCSTIWVDDQRGVWLTTSDAAGEAYRVIGDRVDRVASAARPRGSTFEREQLIAVSGTTVALVSRQPGGVLIAFGSAEQDWTSGGASELQLASGPPRGHEQFQRFTGLDEAGTLVGVVTGPHVTELDDGYLTTSRTYVQRVNPDSTLRGDQTAVPIDVATGDAVGGIASTPNGAFALGTIREPPSEGSDGSLADVVVSRQGPDGQWGALATVFGGAGLQTIRDRTVVGGTIIGVGANWTTDQDTLIESGESLILAGDGTTFSQVSLSIPNSAHSSLGAVCSLADGRALALGFDETASRPFAAIIDVAAATATMTELAITPAPTSLDSCVSTTDGVLVEVETAGDATLVSTTDGTTFTPVDVLEPFDTVWSIASGPAGVAVVGEAGPSSGDGFVLFGRSIAELRRVDVPSLVGPGEQSAQFVVVQDAALVVMGTSNEAPTVWPIAIG